VIEANVIIALEGCPAALYFNFGGSRRCIRYSFDFMAHAAVSKCPTPCELYVNYFDRERRTEGDNPTLGLILCTDKNDAVVKYTLGENQQKKIFASRYKLYLPTEAELKAELQREIRTLGSLIK
jgi:hypothetical protein